MMPDFPAAHSMDTCWFAVDSQGHVACFSTGEAGAVPVQSFCGDEAYGLLSRLSEELSPVAMLDLRGRLVPGALGGPERHQTHFLPGYSTLMFLKSANLIQKELLDGKAQELPATEGVAIVFKELSEELARRIHDAGQCLGCFFYFDDHGQQTGSAIFQYGHLTDNWISGPYGREKCPIEPLHIDDLPDEFHERIQQMRFANLRFSETPHIQPVEHAPCESWESAYLDVTGTKIGPIPGKEAEYGEAYDNLTDIAESIQVEPPPSGNG